MPPSGLTGSRIRERRRVLGITQSRLARSAGISASYLNLIEHNRRRIAGKVLIGLARELGVDPASLAEGAEAEVVAALRMAAARLPAASAEAGRAEEFAGRFPGWASLVASLDRRVGALERTVQTLTDRMAHDPHLAASLHDLLSTVTAINATASILVETREIEDEWRDRFHRNIHEDSQRLAESSQSLVSYLDGAAAPDRTIGSPQEEVEAWLEGEGFHLAELENGDPVDPDRLIGQADAITTLAGAALARTWLQRYRDDAVRMPLAAMRRAMAGAVPDPGALARQFGVDLATALRRMASLPQDAEPGPTGLVICDGSGASLFRKPLDGFTVPRFGAACPLWPLYQALNRPMTPLRMTVEMAGRDPVRFLTYAIAQPVTAADFEAPTVFEATMLVMSARRTGSDNQQALAVGSSCRICPRQGCTARREPSILAAS